MWVGVGWCGCARVRVQCMYVWPSQTRGPQGRPLPCIPCKGEGAEAPSPLRTPQAVRVPPSVLCGWVCSFRCAPGVGAGLMCAPPLHAPKRGAGRLGVWVCSLMCAPTPEAQGGPRETQKTCPPSFLSQPKGVPRRSMCLKWLRPVAPQYRARASWGMQPHVGARARSPRGPSPKRVPQVAAP